MPRQLSLALILAAVAIGIALPPLHGGVYYLTVGISVAIFATIATAFNLVYGYTGLLCFAQVAFLGIGAYGAALLTLRLGWPFWPAAIVGGGFATVFGLVIAYSSLRLSRHAFGIATLTAALLCLILARDWVSLTRGSMGIPGLPAPRLAIGSWQVVCDAPSRYYWLAVGFAVLAIAFMYRLINSRIGRAFLAIRQNEPLAQAQGIAPLPYKLLSVGISAFITGVAGAVLVFHLTIVDPSILDFYYTETMLIMVVVGGAGHFWGVILASVLFTVLPDLLRFSADLRMVLYGAVLIAAMLAFPRGIAGLLDRRKVNAWRLRLDASKTVPAE